jgi:uncharacterized membrane protein
MLIIPPGHYQEISRPRSFGRREKWFIGAGVSLVVVLAVAVVVAFTSVQRTSAHGCIDVSAATAIGGSELYRCGSQARALCTEPNDGGTSNIAFRQALATACRKAGLAAPSAPRSS